MTLPDPLVDLPKPTGDPGAVQLAGGRYRQIGRDLATSAATLRSKVAAGTGTAVWVGQAATSAADVGGRLATAYGTTAEGASSAATVLLTCAAAWDSALADYGRARTLADDAVSQEAAHAKAAATTAVPGLANPLTTTGLTTPEWSSPDRAQAQALARTAIDDFTTAATTCARGLDGLAQTLTPPDPPDPAPPPAPKKHWWDKGVVGAVVHGTEHVVGTGVNILEEIAAHPGHLLDDTAGITLGVGLMLLGSGEEVGGVALDATGVGAIVGVPANVLGGVTIAAGATTATGFAIKAGGDLKNSIMNAQADGAGGGGGGDPAPTVDPGTTPADQQMGNLVKGGNASASQLETFGEEQGWVRVQTPTGPPQYVDENGVVRLTIKSGSARTPGSETPHVEMRNAAGQRIGPDGQAVTKRSAGNHTPIVWDLP